MVADEMLTRKRFREVPPRVEYSLTERARKLMPVLGELARWGYQFAWGPPRDSETVDVGAIFRLAPGLIEPNGSSGTVEFTVEEGEHRLSYCCAVSSDGVVVEEKEPREPDAQVKGNRSDWVRALMPEHDREGLKITGDRTLAEKLLTHLVAEESARRRSNGSRPSVAA
jgi:hypothetical protein